MSAYDLLALNSAEYAAETVMQDVAHIVLFALCLVLGWYVWPLVLGSSPARTPKCPKVLECAGEPGACGARREPELDQGVDGAGLALLEHYGVLGAASGAWAGHMAPTEVEPSQEEAFAYFQAIGLASDEELE